MRIDIYKELNRELVDKVQELKKANAFLEKENIFATAQYFEENQLRIKERQKFLSIISRLKEYIGDAELCLDNNKLGQEIRVTESFSANRRRTSSSGVTTKSPIRTRYSEQRVTEEQHVESGDNVNAWGFHNIEEDSAEKTRSAFSRLSIHEEQADNTQENHVLKKQSQSTNSEIPTISVSSSNKSETNIENTINVLRCSDGLIREETLNHLQSPKTSSINIPIDDFSLNVHHSTPVNHTTDLTTATSATLTDTNLANTNNSSTTRPRRHCAPVSLTEPKINSKLRNDSATCKSKKGKKKRSNNVK